MMDVLHVKHLNGNIFEMKYNERLNNLFLRWIAQSEQNHEPRESGYGDIIFTRDGLLEKNDPLINVEKEWFEAKCRVMFLIKDQPTEYCDDLRLWLKNIDDESPNSRRNKENNRELKSRFMRNLAEILYGLTHNAPSLEEVRQSFEQVKECFNTVPFAFVECKKQGGTTSIADSVLLKYLNTYGALLREEIEILDPNMIVCTNSHIYGFVQKIYDGELSTIEGHNSIRVNRKRNKLIFCSYHPSAWNVNVYDGVMDHYRAFLQLNSKIG